MFYDRYEAGRDLAEKLTEYENTDAVICAIPRGGILIGVAVAKELKLPLEIMIVGTVEHVTQDASIYYAVTETGTYACATDEPLPETEVTQAIAEAKHKRLVYTDSAQLPNWKDKTVIVVDDGAESGLNIKAVVMTLQEQLPKKIIVAVPAAPSSVIEWLENQVDEVQVIKTEPEFTGIIQEHYSHYPEVFDKEVNIAYRHAQHLYEHRSPTT